MRLLLDTCVFLWVLSPERRLTATARKIIADRDNEVFVSSVSIWEILIKQNVGKLSLPEPTADYLCRNRARHGINPLPLTEESLIHLPKLPSLHRDPFDRILVCQAMEHNCTLVTPDPAITAYPVKTLWTNS